MALNVPGLWFMSWYDVSVGPNLEMFNHVRRTAKAADDATSSGRSSRRSRTAPTPAPASTPSSASASMGDARLDYNEIMYGFFDKFLKGEQNDRLEKLPKVTYSRWAATSGRRRTCGRRPARSR